ncbi:beta-sandwich lipoprotein [Escherichia coli]|uniref:beta-sandwich lipoprotein n=1 Tax=Escherichia coli TaxID=562 RepID=UPI000826B0BE|nr:hypothetical protein [Escherichia coli]MDU9626272.1 hypothetical protein [Escherichia coli]
MKKLLMLLAVMLLAACDVNDADVVSQNLSKDSDNFQVNRRFVFYNGITGDYVLTIEGLCTKDNTSTATTLGVICQVGPNQYKKHMLGLSDNVTWFMEQTEPAKVSKYFYKVTFKPSVIVPDIDIR